MSVYKRCVCRDEQGKELGRRCPRLRNGRHGTWYYAVDLPRAGGKRKQMRRGGHASREDAEAAEKKVQGRIDIEAVVDDKETVGEWLDSWLAGQQLRPTTADGYRSNIDNYLKPHLGEIPLEKLRTKHVAAMVRAIEARTEGRRVGPATMHRIRATLRSALSEAVREQRVDVNVAKFVKLPSGQAPRAVVWTPERIAAWRAGAPRPKVAVWTPLQTGQFLDAVQADRLYALWHLMVFTGLRRGETIGARWVDVDLDAGQLTVTEQLVQVGREVVIGPPKSSSGERVVPLDAATVTVLRAYRAAQQRDRLKWGDAWVQSGRVFTREDGSPLRPDAVSGRFKRLVTAADLPPIRLHDLRHGAATISLAAGADMKTVSTMLGHSTITLTANTYSSVLPEVARAAAEAAAALVPRRRLGEV